VEEAVARLAGGVPHGRPTIGAGLATKAMEAAVGVVLGIATVGVVQIARRAAHRVA
jgi:hypothetical protein